VSRRTSRRRALACVFGLLAGGNLACRGAETVLPPGTVFFHLEAPLCSSIVPAEFFIDKMPVGTDTFYVAVGTHDHTTSPGFATGTGRHTLGARVVDGYVWPDRAVAVAQGEIVVDTLHFYCS
jgi:hypothetical protein